MAVESGSALIRGVCAEVDCVHGWTLCADLNSQQRAGVVLEKYAIVVIDVLNVRKSIYLVLEFSSTSSIRSCTHTHGYLSCS